MAGSSNESDETNGRISDLTVSEQHRLLAAERRQVVLELLEGRPTPVALEELAAEVAAREAERGGTDETTAERVAVTLHHMHLPLLDEKGVVDYDLQSQLIEPTW